MGNLELLLPGTTLQIFTSIVWLLYKGLITLAVAGTQEICKQDFIKNEEQPSFSKRYSANFGEVSTM